MNANAVTPVFSPADADSAAAALGFTGDKAALLKGMNIEYEHKKLTHGDPIQTAQIAIDHLKERADYYEALATHVERTNAREYPKFYYCRHMVNGLCGYDDEIVLVDTDAMKRMAPSLNGKPVYNGAHDTRGYDERLEDIKESPCGYVTETFYNEADGWLWSKMIIIDDEAHDNIATGAYSVSNAYIPTDSGAGGVHLNLPYDRRVLNADFTHIALVKNPRYEEAKIYTPEQFNDYQEGKRKQFTNSKTEEKKGSFMKFFKTKKEEVSQIGEATSVELTNSKGEKVEVSVEEMVNAVVAAQAKPQVIKVGDKEMTLDELVNSYKKLNSDAEGDSKKSEEIENEDEVEEKEECNEDEDESKEKANDKPDHFKELANAGLTQSSGAIRLETTNGKLARGKSLYGSRNH